MSCSLCGGAAADAVAAPLSFDPEMFYTLKVNFGQRLCPLGKHSCGPKLASLVGQVVPVPFSCACLGSFASTAVRQWTGQGGAPLAHPSCRDAFVATLDLYAKR